MNNIHFTFNNKDKKAVKIIERLADNCIKVVSVSNSFIPCPILWIGYSCYTGYGQIIPVIDNLIQPDTVALNH